MSNKFIELMNFVRPVLICPGTTTQTLLLGYDFKSMIIDLSACPIKSVHLAFRPIKDQAENHQFEIVSELNEIEYVT